MTTTELTQLAADYYQEGVLDKDAWFRVADAEWFDNPILNDYLRQYQVGDYFEFPQKIIMIQFGDLKRPLLRNAVLKH